MGSPLHIPPQLASEVCLPYLVSHLVVRHSPGTISCLSRISVFNMEFRRYLCVVLLLNTVHTLMLEEDLAEDLESRDLGKAILEMLHINKLSVPRQTKPHPYMKQVYQLLDTQESTHRSDADGTLVQSFRSIQGEKTWKEIFLILVLITLYSAPPKTQQRACSTI